MPVLAIRLKGQMQDLIHATRGYSAWRDPLTLAKVAHRFNALLADLPSLPRRTLVLSGEELSGHMPGRPGIANYNAPPVLAQVYAQAIIARFPQAEVAFYFTTCAPQTWVESAYWVHVKPSSMTLDFEAFATQISGANHDAIVTATRAAIPHGVHGASFDDGGDPIKTLLDLCEVPDALLSDLIHTKPVNTRLPRDVLLELLTANRAYPKRTARKAAKQAILARLQAS